MGWGVVASGSDFILSSLCANWASGYRWIPSVSDMKYPL